MTNVSKNGSWVICIISLGITLGGLVYIVAFSILFMLGPATIIDRGKELFALVMPVLGAWVGAIIAYYYSKENYATANEQAKDLLSVKDKLRSASAKEGMIPVESIIFFNLDNKRPDSVAIKDLLTKFESNIDVVTRLPVLNRERTVFCIVRKGIVYEFLYSKKDCSDNPQFTLKDLIDDDRYKQKIKAMVFVRETDSLEDVQKKMKVTRLCQDAFVTKNGCSDGELLGWITNASIAKIAGLETSVNFQ